MIDWKIKKKKLQGSSETFDRRGRERARLKRYTAGNWK